MVQVSHLLEQVSFSVSGERHCRRRLLWSTLTQPESCHFQPEIPVFFLISLDTLAPTGPKPSWLCPSLLPWPSGSHPTLGGPVGLRRARLISTPRGWWLGGSAGLLTEPGRAPDTLPPGLRGEPGGRSPTPPGLRGEPGRRAPTPPQV